VSVYRRQPKGPYYTDVRWQGFPRIQVSTGTTNKSRAKAMVSTLKRLCDIGRRDVVSLVASGRLRLADVHDDYLVGRELLEQRIARTASPALGELVDDGSPISTVPLLCPKRPSVHSRRTLAVVTGKAGKDSLRVFQGVVRRVSAT
jgi:hypothetical protein